MVNLQNILNNPALYVGAMIRMKPIIKKYYNINYKKSSLIQSKFIKKHQFKEFKRIQSFNSNE